MKRESSLSTSLSALLALACTFSLTFTTPAQAKLRINSSQTFSVGTASWAAVITNQGSAGQAVPYVTSWSPLPGTQTVFIDALNFGTLDLLGQTFVITTVDPSSSRQNSPKITFDACVGATWNANANTCAGTVTSIGTSSNASVTSSLPIPAQSRLSLRLVVTKTTRVAWTTTLNITVNRAQVRQPVTSNT